MNGLILIFKLKILKMNREIKLKSIILPKWRFRIYLFVNKISKKLKILFCKHDFINIVSKYNWKEKCTKCGYEKNTVPINFII